MTNVYTDLARSRLPGFPRDPAATAVVCHDAGACNLILPWLDQPGLRLQAWVAGPAEALWRHRFGGRGLCGTIQEALDGAAMLVSGTGWASSMEHDARLEAARRGLYSVAVIDHWVNYAQRFEREGRVQWPDEFWLTDPQALALAARHFPCERLRLQPNLHLAEQLAAVGPPPPPEHAEILYLLEPARSRWGRDVEGEWQALAWFETTRRRAGIPDHAPLRLRPHPSDPPGKYSAWLAERPHVVLDREPTLARALSGARWVVGCESHALTVALACGRQVYTSLPPWAPPCRLPHEGIRPLASHA